MNHGKWLVTHNPQNWNIYGTPSPCLQNRQAICQDSPIIKSDPCEPPSRPRIDDPYWPVIHYWPGPSREIPSPWAEQPRGSIKVFIYSFLYKVCPQNSFPAVFRNCPPPKYTTQSLKSEKVVMIFPACHTFQDARIYNVKCCCKKFGMRYTLQ